MLRIFIPLENIYSPKIASISEFNITRYDQLQKNGQENMTHSLFVEVDLTVPDKMLLETFVSLIAKERCKRSIDVKAKFISKATFRKWHASRVLAYMDLVKWHELNNSSITDGQAGLIIYPDDNRGGVAERIRKTTKPLVKKLGQLGILRNVFLQTQNTYRK
jgi:hypothetical protein